MTCFRKGLPLAIALFSLAACTDDDTLPPAAGGGGAGADGGGGSAGEGGTGGDGGAPGECPVLTPVDTSLYFGAAAPTALYARVDQPLAGYASTRLTMELYPLEGMPVEPGTFDLSLAPDDSYETCQHCVLLVAFDETGFPRRAFFQESGTMTIGSYDENEPSVVAGSIEDAHLVEVTQNLDGSWNVVPDGLCYELPEWSFDTTVVDGGPCERVEDCPNEVFQICDVDTHTCQPPECDLFGDLLLCDPGYRCMSQYGALIDRVEAGPATGACYPVCEPEGPGAQGDCTGGETCFALDATQEFGVCLETGDKAIGEACDLPDVGTGCGEGGLCTGDPPTCHAICDYLTGDIACPSDTYCTSLNLCEPLAVGDLAPVGALCEPGAASLTDCGPEGEAFRGICFRLFESLEDATCERICATASPACPAATECLSVFTNPNVGLCLDPGACGDGAIDLLGGEVCDDGNTDAGDGCSGDCSAAELGPLCSVAEPLAAGAATVDSTEGGPSGYTSLCDAFIATPVKTYSFLPPAPGELTLRVASFVPMGISLLGDCADNGSELGCRFADTTATLRVDFIDVPAEPALVVVRGATPIDTGTFLLEADYVAAVCGDFTAVGPEACDDGNTDGGDGCSADCTAVEWPELCAGLPVVDPGDSIAGNLDLGSEVFDLSFVCSFESGRERAYSFTAPSAGQLSVSLTSDENLVVFVRDGCGPIDGTGELSCGNSVPGSGTETSMTALAAGQQVTIVVDGFTRDDAGDFTLDVAFAP
jgi:cysteine-rich repeat protein